MIWSEEDEEEDEDEEMEDDRGEDEMIFLLGLLVDGSG